MYLFSIWRQRGLLLLPTNNDLLQAKHLNVSIQHLLQILLLRAGQRGLSLRLGERSELLERRLSFHDLLGELLFIPRIYLSLIAFSNMPSFISFTAPLKPRARQSIPPICAMN